MPEGEAPVAREGGRGAREKGEGERQEKDERSHALRPPRPQTLGYIGGRGKAINTWRGGSTSRPRAPPPLLVRLYISF
jgi:hypothetical protein